MPHCYRNSTFFHFHALQKQVKMFWKIFKTWKSFPARWELEFMVSLHSNLVSQAKKPQYFHQVSASLPPSSPIKHFSLKTTFQSKMFVFIFFFLDSCLILNRQTLDPGAIAPLFIETLTIMISPLEMAPSAATTSSSLASVPQKLSSWVFGWQSWTGKQVG